MTGSTLDAGALIALERGSPRMRALVSLAVERGARLAVPAGALAQAWRGGPGQVRIARLLRASVCEVVPLDHRVALGAGMLCAHTGTSDVVDASVVLCARERGHQVVTSDPGDLRALDPSLTLVAPS